MTLDIAHLHIAAHDLGFDYLAAVAAAAPWVKHLHANDNFGRLDQGFDNEVDRWAYGEADIHLPPGWGSIPRAWKSPASPSGERSQRSNPVECRRRGRPRRRKTT